MAEVPRLGVPREHIYPPAATAAATSMSATNNAYGITKRKACIDNTTTTLTFQPPSSGVVTSPASWRPAFCALVPRWP